MSPCRGCGALPSPQTRVRGGCSPRHGARWHPQSGILASGSAPAQGPSLGQSPVLRGSRGPCRQPPPPSSVGRGGSRPVSPAPHGAEARRPRPSWHGPSAELMQGMSSRWLRDRRVQRAARGGSSAGTAVGGQPPGWGEVWGDPVGAGCSPCPCAGGLGLRCGVKGVGGTTAPLVHAAPDVAQVLLGPWGQCQDGQGQRTPQELQGRPEGTVLGGGGSSSEQVLGWPPVPVASPGRASDAGQRDTGLYPKMFNNKAPPTPQESVCRSRAAVPSSARCTRHCPQPRGGGHGVGARWQHTAATCKAGQCRRRRRRRPKAVWGGRAHRGRPGPTSARGPSAP